MLIENGLEVPESDAQSQKYAQNVGSGTGTIESAEMPLVAQNAPNELSGLDYVQVPQTT